MEDNIRFIQKQIDKNRANAQATRRQAEVERNKANGYSGMEQQDDRNLHNNQAQQLDEKANQLEADADALEPKKAEIEARINELKAERNTINRQTLDRTVEIDKELARIQ